MYVPLFDPSFFHFIKASIEAGWMEKEKKEKEKIYIYIGVFCHPISQHRVVSFCFTW